MTEETKIVRIYNEKYNKYWSCTLKSYKHTWCNNGWVLVGIDETERKPYKEVERPWEKPVKQSFFKKLFHKIFIYKSKS